MDSVEAIKQTSHRIVLGILHNITSDDLSEDRDLFSLNLDSINAIRLIVNLQSTFEVAFDTNDINLENFRTIGNIAELISRKKGL